MATPTPLGIRLRQERHGRGWSLDRAEAESRALGQPIKRATIYAVEEGLSGQPRREHLTALSILYNIPLDELATLVYANGESASPRQEDAQRPVTGGTRRGKATAST